MRFCNSWLSQNKQYLCADYTYSVDICLNCNMPYCAHASIYLTCPSGNFKEIYIYRTSEIHWYDLDHEYFKFYQGVMKAAYGSL